MSEIIVYSLENCPHCEEVKGFLIEKGFEYSEKDMSDMDSLVDMRCEGVYAMEAPVLKVGPTWYTSDKLYSGGKLQLQSKDGNVYV